MPDAPARPVFVILVNTKQGGKTVRIDNVDDMEAFLYNFSNKELARCVWESVANAYKHGLKSGLKKAALNKEQ